MRSTRGHVSKRLICCLSFLLLVIPTACSTIGSLAGQAGVQLPGAEFTGARLRGLSFDRVDLELDLQITNPNPLAIRLSGFSYDMSIEERSFIQGTEDREVNLKANGKSTVPLPLTISFDHLYTLFKDLRQKDTAEYLLQCSLFFDLPVLGRTEIPASRRGDVPLPKIPSVNIRSLALERLDLSGADLMLSVQLENPNAFAMALKGMQYQVFVNDQTWASGETDEQVPLAERGNGLVRIPISLDLLRMGTSIADLLRASEPLSVRLLGDLDLNTSLPLLDHAHIPFDLRSDTEITRP